MANRQLFKNTHGKKNVFCFGHRNRLEGLLSRVIMCIRSRRSEKEDAQETNTARSHIKTWQRWMARSWGQVPTTENDGETWSDCFGQNNLVLVNQHFGNSCIWTLEPVVAWQPYMIFTTQKASGVTAQDWPLVCYPSLPSTWKILPTPKKRGKRVVHS